jgi:hypothetical protein
MAGFTTHPRVGFVMSGYARIVVQRLRMASRTAAGSFDVMSLVTFAALIPMVIALHLHTHVPGDISSQMAFPTQLTVRRDLRILFNRRDLKPGHLRLDIAFLLFVTYLALHVRPIRFCDNRWRGIDLELA